MNEPTQICRGFTDEQWKGLRERLIHDGQIQDDETAWSCAVDLLVRRIRERFLSCIEALEKADPRLDINSDDLRGAPPDCSTLPDDEGKQVVVPGFAIMTLCCLLIETLQSFREAREGEPARDTFGKFLRLPAFGGEFDDDLIVRDFVRGIRDGIVHDAETRGWVIWRDEPVGQILESHDNSYTLNRTAFYKALKSEFEEYVRQLRDTRKQNLRKRFVEKMDGVVGKS